MKKLLCLMLFCLLLNSTIYAGNRPGFMTPDQKDALDGADTPSASNVLATANDVTAADTGVQTAGAGVNLSNSGDADNPILDLDISEDIDMNTSYQLKNLAAPAADGEAIRQTAKITESGLESGIDRLNELEETDTPQFASVNIAGNYQFPQAIGSSGQALKVPSAGSLLEWGSAGGASYAQVVDVAKSGGDYTTITAALNDISDADSVVRYAIKLHPGEYDETVTCKEWVDIIGVDRHTCRITKSDAHTMVSAANVTIANLSLYNTHASASTYTFYNASSASVVMRNCYIEKLASLAGTQFMVLYVMGLTDFYNCEVYGYNTGAGGVTGVITNQSCTIDNCKITAKGSGAQDRYVQALELSGGNLILLRSYFEVEKSSSHWYNNAVTVNVGSITAYDCEFISNDIYSFLSKKQNSLLKGCYLNSGMYLPASNADIYLYNSTVKGSIVGIDGWNNKIYSYCSHYDALTFITDYPQTKAKTIANVPTGNIAATNVQDAVGELDDEKIQQEKGYNVKMDFGSSDIVTDGSGDGTVIADYDDYSVAPTLYICLGEDMNDTSFVLCVDVAYSDTALLRLREGAASDTITINWQSMGQE